MAAAQNSMKVILVGNSGVGKTCLISAYYRQTFDVNTTANVAPAYSYSDVINNEGVSVRLQIWDTAGQEKYLSVNQLFFRDADVAIICFESCDENSLNSIKDWVKRVRDEVPSCQFIFVMTKIDLKSKEEIDAFKKRAETKIAEYGGSIVHLTSALSKEGVNEIFYLAADYYTSQFMIDQSIQDITENNLPESKGCCL